jgi:hypothetical protein
MRWRDLPLNNKHVACMYVLQVADFGLSKQKQQTYVTGVYWHWIAGGLSCCCMACCVSVTGVGLSA